MTAVFLAVLCYVVSGVVYNWKQNGAKVGVAALPHRSFWLEVYSLVKDGVAFARAPNQRSNYSTIRMTPSIGAAAGGATERDAPANKKQNRESRGGRSTDSRKARKKEKPETNVLPLPVDTSSELAAGGSSGASTPTGGNGRWVHVPT